MKSTLDRREFLSRAGLTLAIAATPSSFQVLAMGQDTPSELFSPGPWLQITPDNRVTVLLCKTEMGQGIHTAIPMIVADELEADWGQVETEMAPVEAEFADPVHHMHATFGSQSIRHLYLPLRKLGAAGREILIQAAAGKWNVAVGECEAALGKVQHKSSGRSFSYGELVEAAASIPVPENPTLKQKSERTLMGTPIARIDIPAKVRGEAKYGIDTFVPQEGAAERCRDCQYEESCPAAYRPEHHNYIYRTRRQREDREADSSDICVFNSDKDSVDNAALSARYENGVNLSFSFTITGGRHDRRFLLVGREGHIEASQGDGTIAVWRVGAEPETTTFQDELRREHGGGDEFMMESFFDCVATGNAPVAGITSGLHSVLLAAAATISIDQAGRNVDIRPYLHQLS